MDLSLEWLLSTCEALDSIPSTFKRVHSSPLFLGYLSGQVGTVNAFAGELIHTGYFQSL